MFLLFALLMLDPAPKPDLTALAEPAGGRVGFAAVDLGSGRSLGLNEDEAFPTQSTFKLPIAIEVLHQVDAGTLDLDRVIALEAADARLGAPGTIAVPSRKTVGALLEAMIIHSDNVACDKLLALLGGPGVVDARVRTLGVDGITIKFSEREMQTSKVDNSATPAAMVSLLAKVAGRRTGLSPASAGRLDDLLGRVATGQKRLKGELPPGTPVAHKTGTSQTGNGQTDATNDVGLISLPNGDRIAIAVFVHASPADEATRERTIAHLARFAFDRFNEPAPAFEVRELAWPPFETVRLWAPAAAPPAPEGRYETLLLLHGNRPTGSDKTYLTGLAREPQFRQRILIAPGLPDGDHGWDRPEVTRALAALVAKIAATTPVDPRRTFVLGHSAGGSRALPVAQALSIPAAGVVSLGGDIGRPFRSLRSPGSAAAPQAPLARPPVLLICNSGDVGPNASCDLDRRNRELLTRLGFRDLALRRLEASHGADFSKLAPVVDDWIRDRR